jgi:hypothetical protein
MRKTILTLSISILGFFVLGAASCSGSSIPGNGGSSGTGAGGTTGTGSGGSSGAGGTKGTASGGSSGSGSGGTMGTEIDAGNSGPEDAATAGLDGGELNASCKTCIAGICFSQFKACEGIKGCIPAVDCIANCYYTGKAATLTACGTLCAEAEAGSTVTNAVTEAVLCAATYCESACPTPK